MPAQRIPVSSPVKGINRVVNREGQPPDTCWDALNVLPYDRFGRRRVAQRPGTSKQYTTQMSGSTRVQGMLQVSQISYPVTLNSTGLTLFVEPFTSLTTFQQNWLNVPSTWTVSSNKLHVPSNYEPATGTPPLTLVRPLVTGTLTMTLNVTPTYNSTSASTSNVFFGFNYTGSTGAAGAFLPTVASVQLLLTPNTNQIRINMRSNGGNDTSAFANVASGSTYAFSLTVNYTAFTTSTSTVGGSGPTTGNLSRTAIPSSLIPFIGADTGDGSTTWLLF